ncbi:MAG: 4a-hydroxytetrahydrobiopterin dehydratase [Bacteroidia bacterium]|nr:4a-hydroxytetrahydrobiopterin dehydratase [Bacteroidia bacterium]
MSWINTGNNLKKTFTFKDFPEALAWMVKAAFIIEKMNHHPEWTNVYNKIHVSLSTHDAGNTVTDKDHKLAEELDKL